MVSLDVCGKGGTQSAGIKMKIQNTLMEGAGGVCVGRGGGGALNRPMSCNGSISGGVIAAASLTPD